MKRLVILISFISSIALGYGQKPEEVIGSYTFRAAETMSVAEAKRIALDRAKLQAIEEKYGTNVSQNNSTYISNKDGKTESHFYSSGMSEVKGEWVETIGEPDYEVNYEDGMTIVKCTVKGKIMPQKDVVLDFDAHILCNGTDLKFERSDFKDGDDMYLFFKSPYSGYLSVFLHDFTTGMVSRLLPYRMDNKPLQPIKNNTEYIFFSDKGDDDSQISIVDEYIMTCSDEIEHNEMWIIFSTKPFIASNTSMTSTGLQSFSVEEFSKWKSKIINKSNEIKIRNYPIAIYPK